MTSTRTCSSSLGTNGMNREQRYYGQYIAMPSFNNQTVIAFGRDPEKVHSEAKEITETPVIVYVPRKGAIMIL